MKTELSSTQRAGVRSLIFRHLDGFAIASSALALIRGGVLDKLSDGQKHDLADLTKMSMANEGYLNVALRILSSQGWLTPFVEDNGETICYQITEKGKVAIQYTDMYKLAVSLFPQLIAIDDYLYKGKTTGKASLPEIMEFYFVWRDKLENNDATPDFVKDQMLVHLEGIISGPALVSLGMHDFFKQYNQNNPCFTVDELEGSAEHMQVYFDWFTNLGWFTKEGNSYCYTAEGLFHCKRASAYGVTVSYLRTFEKVNELIYGNPKLFWERPMDSPEIHVDRVMNVWGSGGAHSTYFKKIDEIIIDIFNRPIQEQPKGFADMGSGNGAFIEHLFDVIWEHTERGKMLEEHPLFIVGSDLNEAALTVTRDNLKKADVWAKVAFGDIGDPNQLAVDLKKEHGIDLGDLLNVRSFLDHNRIYEAPEKVDDGRMTKSTGAFAFRGRRIHNAEVEQNLVDHFKKWAPYVKKYGLLVIELHTIDPILASANIGKTAVTAYDGTHGYSDQYIVALNVFLSAAKEAGLHPDDNHQFRFPDGDLATVSINLLKA